MSTPLRGYTLNHMFLCTTVGAPEADRLVQFGLTDEATGVVSFVARTDPLMELGFDGERQGQCLDVRPHLPLKRCW